jgi:hypothetical protein
MASAHKKVVLRQFGGELKWGYLAQSGFVGPDRHVNLLDLTGKVISLPLSDIKTIAYVKDFNLNDTSEPERLGRRTFATRPRGPGLWVRVRFRDGEALEGISHFDAAFLDAAISDQGLFLLPADGRSNTQRLFIPRPALTSLEAVTAVSREPRRAAPAHLPHPGQGGLFEPSE